MLTKFLSVAVPALLIWPVSAAHSPPVTSQVVDTGHVVLIGVEGLTWPDVSPNATPALWDMLDAGAPAATLSMYSTTRSCAPDGWLTVSTGVPTSVRDAQQCLTPLPTGSGDSVVMSNWDAISRLQRESPFNPELGRFVGELGQQQICIGAFGPEAAATAADADGVVEHYVPTPIPRTPFDDTCAVSVVAAGSISSVGGREEADEVVAQVIDAMPQDATAVVFSVPSGQAPERTMGVVIQYQPGQTPTTPQYLSSPSTRWPGVVSLIDLPPTVFELLGQTPSTTWAGSAWSATDGPDDVASVPDELGLIGARDDSLRQVTWFFLGSSVLIGLVLLGTLAVGWSGNGPIRELARRTTSSLRLATWLVAFPVASFAVGALPWWRATSPITFLYASALVLTAILGELLLILARRRGVYWASLVVTSTLTLIIMLDLATGQLVSRGSPLAPSPLSGGRFYGLSNAMSASLAVGAVWSVTLLAGLLMNRSGRRPAMLLFSGFSAVVILMTALPSLGADIGGALTLLPTFAVTGIYLFRVRMNVWRTTLVLGTCIFVPIAVALADYARPAEDRTHLGRFVELVASGQAWELVSRKAGYAAGSLVSLLSLLTLVTLLIIAWQLFRLLRHRPLGELWAGLQRSRVLAAAVLGSWTAMVTGSILNDYGIRMATIGLIMLVPLLLLNLPRSSTFSSSSSRVDDDGLPVPAPTGGPGHA